jgi:alkylation response protein AidB-like acyl-CoA dehydrogenase
VHGAVSGGGDELRPVPAGVGDIFAAGYGEVGNDVPVLFATSQAARVDGGWEATGHKIFGSMSPLWTWLGIHVMDTSDPAAPQVIDAFVHRDSPRYHIEETWDTLGMRATMSNDTIFDRTLVPDQQVVAICPAGFAGAGSFHVALFAWACSAPATCTSASPSGSTTRRSPGCTSARRWR